MVRPSYGFSKQERLSGKKDIEELFAKGSSFRLQSFVIKYLIVPKSVGLNQILISVPKRKFKRAVDRNLIKRRIRESYRLNKSILSSQESDYIIGFIYLSKSILTFHEIQDQLIKALQRLNKIKEKKNEETN